MTLEERLREIKLYNPGQTRWLQLSDKEIALIKQAFQDEGWVHKPFLKHLLQTNDAPVYTGQEWYDRFVEALPFRDFGMTRTDREIFEAARKAAGL